MNFINIFAGALVLVVVGTILLFFSGLLGPKDGYYEEFSIIEVEFDTEVTFEVKIPVIRHFEGITDSMQSLAVINATPVNSVIEIAITGDFLELTGHSQHFQLASTTNRTLSQVTSGERFLFSLIIATNYTSKISNLPIDYYIGVDQPVKGYISFFFDASKTNLFLF